MKKKNIKFKNGLLWSILFLLCGITGCKKFLEVDIPPTNVTTKSAYRDDASAIAVLTGIYTQIINNAINTYTIAATSYYEELSADNLVLNDVSGHPAQASFYKNELLPSYITSGNQTYWKDCYKLIYTLNASIEGLTNNKYLTPKVAERLLGEAYFMRAFCYFYLVNLYGDVPLVLHTEYVNNIKLARSPVASVYAQITSDLNNAEPLLDYNYADADAIKTTEERIRPNRAAVNALQARVQLYLKDYPAAEASATKVISQNTYALTTLSNTFLRNSSETIWAMQPLQNNYNTPEGFVYLLPDSGPDYDRTVYISKSLLQSFEAGDARKDEWIKTIIVDTTTFDYPTKYKIGFVAGSTSISEYSIVLRLAEQYLIRAEARNEQDNIIGSITDLNTLRTRSRAIATPEVPNPLPDIATTHTKVELRSIILKERRTELFAEWGHRWFDLKRTNNIDTAMIKAQAFKENIWKPYKALYPIPISDILLNTALIQNKEYNN